MNRVTAIISALVICIVVCLSWGVNHYRDNAIAYKEQRDKNASAKWHLNRSQFGIRIDHDLASISDHSLASQSITIWHA
ncbi:hypothetical protein ACM2K2_09125, partial [Escherichia coli]